ncbi:MAG TPA: hypothetical protein PLJ12_12235, partial [Planctomycetota bacterium]|nr:hypothetical protein [Planctomycetota bacterium]
SILAVWPELLSDPKFWPNDEVPEGMKIRAQVMKSMLAARCSEVKRVKDRSPREFAAFLANANVLRLAMEFLIKWDAGSGIEYEQYIAQLAELGVKRAGI